MEGLLTDRMQIVLTKASFQASHDGLAASQKPGRSGCPNHLG
jgi:hypothetical protein